MKNMLSKSLPILFLVTALAFMMIFHHEDELSDAEAIEFETLSNIDHTIDPRAEKENEYRFTSDDEMVSVFDSDGNQVFEISLDQWENNQDYYYEKYNLN